MKLIPLAFRPRLVVGNRPAPGSRHPGAGQRDFRAEVLPHLDGAYNLARYLTRDPVLSEDVVQDAFVRAYRAFDEFRGGSVRAWLFTIVRNCCHSALAARRSTSRHTVLANDAGADADTALENVPDEQPTPEAALIQQREIASVRASVEALPEPFREAIVLRELEELSYREIAEVTGVALGTVMSRIARGRSMLADILIGRRDAAAGNGTEAIR